MSDHKIKSVLPEGNTMADLEPWRYFNFALEKVQKAENNIKTSNDPCQYLLVNLDMLITICKKYPIMASMNICKLKRKPLKDNFYAWFDRNKSKIPAKYRDGIKASADELFSELMQIKSIYASE